MDEVSSGYLVAELATREHALNQLRMCTTSACRLGIWPSSSGVIWTWVSLASGIAQVMCSSSYTAGIPGHSEQITPAHAAYHLEGTRNNSKFVLSVLIKNT